MEYLKSFVTLIALLALRTVQSGIQRCCLTVQIGGAVHAGSRSKESPLAVCTTYDPRGSFICLKASYTGSGFILWTTKIEYI